MLRLSGDGTAAAGTVLALPTCRVGAQKVSIAQADAEPACQPVAPDVATRLTIVPQPPTGRRYAAHDPLRHDDEGHHREQTEPQCGPPTVAGLFQLRAQRRPQHDHAEERHGRDAQVAEQEPGEAKPPAAFAGKQGRDGHRNEQHHGEPGQLFAGPLDPDA